MGIFQRKHPLATHFDKQCQKHGNSPKAVGWFSEYTQYQRYIVLSMMGDWHNKSILDVGCGQADFHTFCLQENIATNYTGIDISQEMIQIAKTTHPKAELIQTDFFKFKPHQTYDFVIGSGLFSYKRWHTQRTIKKGIKKMLKMANIAVGINFLSTYTSKKDQQRSLNYFSPEKMMTLALTLSPYVEIKHHYLPNDFTVIIYKK